MSKTAFTQRALLYSDLNSVTDFSMSDFPGNETQKLVWGHFTLEVFFALAQVLLWLLLVRAKSNPPLPETEIPMANIELFKLCVIGVLFLNLLR